MTKAELIKDLERVPDDEPLYVCDDEMCTYDHVRALKLREAWGDDEMGPLLSEAHHGYEPRKIWVIES